MHFNIHQVLHVVAPAIMIVGMIFGIPRFFNKGNVLAMLSWSCITTGFVLAIIAIYVKLNTAYVLAVIAPAIIILGLLFIMHKFMCNRSVLLKFGFISLIAGLVLMIIALYMGAYVQSILYTVGYAVLILGLVCSALKYIEGEGCLYAYSFSWLCLLAGLVLEIIALHV